MSLSSMNSSFFDLEDGSKRSYPRTTSVDDDSSIGTLAIDNMDAPLQRRFAAKESRKVRRTKYFVMLFLLIIMICVSVTTYYWISNDEYDEFDRQFQEDSHKVLSTMGRNLVRSLEASDAFVASITSLAAATNQQWPFVVIPDFAIRAEKIRSLVNAVYVSTYHTVQPNERREWEGFTKTYGESMVNESIEAIEAFDGADWPIVWNYTLWDVIHGYDEFEKKNAGEFGTNTKGPWLPMWQTQPTISYAPPYNWDLSSQPLSSSMNTTAYQKLIDTHKVTITDAYLISSPDDVERYENDKDEADWIQNYLLDDEEPMEPISDIYYPILSEANKQIKLDNETIGENVAGIFSLSIYWRDTIKNILPLGSNGLIAVFENPCNPTFTYQINGPDVVFLGAGDFHDERFNNFAIGKHIHDLAYWAMSDTLYSGIDLDHEFCPFKITLYPSEIFEKQHITKTPSFFAAVTVIIFAVTALTFIIYDFWVERRQKVVMKTAMTTTKLVTSLFPDVVIDQMLPALDDVSIGGYSQPKKLQSFLNKESNGEETEETEIIGHHPSKPIAELFPDTTVYFADIAGFTAWSSVREPSQVFVLLETLYGSFDKIAKQYGIFKVETIGDSYVAVCGLPEPRKNHAVAMAKFAFACREKMKEKLRDMELTLGPGTADLGLRTGLHSGPTIAGVLRGDKARFQLFGDTVNTTARMESTCKTGKIQVSQKTAELLIGAGKESWLTAREELVSAKGKGMLQTYWLERRSRSRSMSTAVSDFSCSDLTEQTFQHGLVVDQKIQRLIDWNVTIFKSLLEEIVLNRRPSSQKKVVESSRSIDKNVRDEVVETIQMPEYSSSAFNNRSSRTNFTVSPEAVQELRDYITRIASFYHSDNDFHNFEHASHVIMSTVKLLQRIASPDVKKKDCETERDYFNYTFGISSDPLTKFAIVFSALIHDVDHQGVSNNQLSKENDPMAEIYNHKSILEQHSLDLAWSLLEESSFSELRKCIFTTQEEYKRFRQLSVNCVIATDIFDMEMKSFRDSRWEKAFKSKHVNQENDAIDDWNRKATITIECIIQASDVSHTMQHWHVYQKWNKCLFNEMYTAYHEGRSERNPAMFWYEGELKFFDNYIIPLATKLRECEVFGVSCDEFLNFANENRKEWAVKGEAIVYEMLQDAEDRAGRGKYAIKTK